MNTRREAGHQQVSIAVRQDVTQRATRVPLGDGVLRYLYDLSHDSKVSSEPGQDFLAVRHTHGSTAFAVCDGVGASFLGHLAAQYMGQTLVDWLSDARPFESEAELQWQLSRFLAGLVDPARTAIERYPLPATLPSLIRTVLEEKRAYGSEAMFVCGQLRWPATHGTGSVALACLGDAEVQILGRSGRTMVLTGRQEERWSTHRGVRGQVKTIWRSAQDVVRVIAYSDGLRSVSGDLHRLGDDALDREMVRLGDNPLSDDLSLVDIAFDERDMPPGRQGATATRRGEAEVEAPRFVSPPNDALVISGDRVSWTEVPGARGYRIEQATNARFDPTEVVIEEVRGCWIIFRERETGSYCYRVRALFGSAEGEWSAPLCVFFRQ